MLILCYNSLSLAYSYGSLISLTFCSLACPIQSYSGITYRRYWGRFCAQFCACYSSHLSLAIITLLLPMLMGIFEPNSSRKPTSLSTHSLSSLNLKVATEGAFTILFGRLFQTFTTLWLKNLLLMSSLLLSLNNFRLFPLVLPSEHSFTNFL